MVFRGALRRSLFRTLFEPFFNSGGPTHHFGQSRSKRCPEKHQKRHFSVTFDVKKTMKKTRKDTILVFSRLFEIQGALAYTSGQSRLRNQRKQQKTVSFLLFSAVLSAPSMPSGLGMRPMSLFTRGIEKARWERRSDLSDRAVHRSIR